MELYVHDLAALACNAAFELDEISIGRGTGSEATLLTAKWLMDRVDAYPLMPSMNKLLEALLRETKMLTVPVIYDTELMKHLEKVAMRLDSVARHPERYRENNPEELCLMRQFCNELSRYAQAYDL